MTLNLKSLCKLCTAVLFKGHFCDSCAVDLLRLVEPNELPPQDASDEEVLAWFKKNEISVFTCGASATGERP
jgi:hypothetical protein